MKKNLYFITGSTIAFLVSIGLGISTGIEEVRNAVFLSFIIHWILFIPAYIMKTEKFYDISGTFTYITLIFYVFFSSMKNQINYGNVITSIFIIFWSIRLGTFLFNRIKKAGEDKRFREIKKSFSWFFMAWTFSGMWVAICSLCALTAIANGIQINTISITGILIFIFGISIEIIADLQKTNFRKNPINKDKFIRTGLWKYSRHPNYLGEIILWIGIAIISLPSLELRQMFTLISPLFTYILLTRISGINLLEKSGDEKWGHREDYLLYKKETPRLIMFL